MQATQDDPFERRARPLRQASFRTITLSPDDPVLLATLRGWDWVARSLLLHGVTPSSRYRLEDSRRIVGELLRVLQGEEEGEGVADERQVRAAVANDRIQAVTSLYLCPRAAFIELLASAPWNLLGPDDRPDARTVRGAGHALVIHAAALSRAQGGGGRVALQAENARSLTAYQRMGFTPIRPSDVPLALVPRGEHGWSPAVLRLARGVAGPEERRTPWLVRDPARTPDASAWLASRPHSPWLRPVSAGAMSAPP
jgi:hypothetical protein